MEWTDEGLILSARAYGETSVILELLTRGHGRHLGLVRGGRSRTKRPMLQPGNQLQATWRARLDEHLGMFIVEPLKSRAALIMEDAATLAGLNSLCVLAGLMPERDPHREFFEATVYMADQLAGGGDWPVLMAFWERGLLDELGFGLDLTSCAVSGTSENLAYVSPKSGRAVTLDVGEPYKEKLLNLPAFLTAGGHEDTDALQYSPDDLLDGFRLTGYFLEKHVYFARDQKLPEARARMIAKIGQK